MKKAVLLSVSDRTGLIELAEKLKSKYVLLATTGTAKLLNDAGIPNLAIEDYTKQKEILDGRVKTLHPKIHAGLLAKRNKPEHLEQLESDEIMEIEIAIVNLYPFIQNLKSDKIHNPENMVELVDIGGPTMIRAAAKNFQSVYAVIDPSDYDALANILDSDDAQEKLNFRLYLSSKVFTTIAEYDLEIAKYFSNVLTSEAGFKVNTDAEFFTGNTSGVVLKKKQDLRYGENPHQSAGFYTTDDNQNWEQINGKELSYNNFLDFDAAFKLVNSLESTKPTAVIIKHLNPCGVAIADNLKDAVVKAKLGDTRSHFGGIIACNVVVDGDAAEEIAKDFAEIVVAPDFSEKSLEILQKKKNLRLIKIKPATAKFELRSCAGGYLIQENDLKISDVSNAKGVAGKLDQISDLDLAWKICAQVKSNAIVLVKDGILIGVGAGQMSRIDSVELAITKARFHGHDIAGAVAASDAFFPFPDSVEKLSEAGVKSVIVTGGASRDQEVIDTANKFGINLLFTEDRHFKH